MDWSIKYTTSVKDLRLLRSLRLLTKRTTSVLDRCDMKITTSWSRKDVCYMSSSSSSRNESVRSKYTSVPACGRFVSIEPEKKGKVKIMEKKKLSCLVGKKVTASPSPKLGVQKVVFKEITENVNEDNGLYNLTVIMKTENGGEVKQMFFQKSIEDGSDRLVEHLSRIFGTYNEETQRYEIDLDELFVEGLEFTADVAYSNKGVLQAYPPRVTQTTVESEPAITGA